MSWLSCYHAIIPSMYLCYYISAQACSLMNFVVISCPGQAYMVVVHIYNKSVFQEAKTCVKPPFHVFNNFGIVCTFPDMAVFLWITDSYVRPQCIVHFCTWCKFIIILIDYSACACSFLNHSNCFIFEEVSKSCLENWNVYKSISKIMIILNLRSYINVPTGSKCHILIPNRTYIHNIICIFIEVY